MRTADDVVWAMLLAALGAIITTQHAPSMPPAVLWVGWFGIAAGIVLLLRWWLKVVR